MHNTPVTRRSVSETVVQNLRVLAIDAIETKPGAVAANGGFGRTVTLEVSPDQVEKINVATELGKLSVALRSTLIAASTSEAVKPQWAGDVSPALFGAAQEKPTAIVPRPIQVIRGSKNAEAVKPEN
jgi:pilus assembly protein CpaB